MSNPFFIPCTPEEQPEQYETQNGLIFNESEFVSGFYECDGREGQWGKELHALGAEPQKQLPPPEGGPWELKYGKDCSGEKPQGAMAWQTDELEWVSVTPGRSWGAPVIYAIPLPSTQEQSDVQRESVEEAKEVGLPDAGTGVIINGVSRRVVTLKVWPEYFRDIKSGAKPFELRKNDRGFRVGDVLELLEWHQDTGYSGEDAWCEITYILEDAVQFGLMEGYAILGLAEIPESSFGTKQAEPQEPLQSPTKQEAVSPGEGYRWVEVDEILPQHAEMQRADDGVWIPVIAYGEPTGTAHMYRIPTPPVEPVVERKMPTEEQMMEGFTRWHGGYSLDPNGRFIDQEIQRRYNSWKGACTWFYSRFNPLSVSKEGGEA